VCTTVPSLPVPSSNDENGGGDGDCDPLSINTNGSQILFFVAEENLEEQLEKLRAA
jgi:hypothetical protein